MATAQNVKQVNRELQRLGLGHLKDPNLMDQMAYLVRDHAHFRHMLMHMPVPDRHEVYKCLAPKLRFKARPLEDYEIESKQEAEKLQLPEYDPKTLEVREWGSRHVEMPEFKASEEVEYACSCTSLIGPSAHCQAHSDALQKRIAAGHAPQPRSVLDEAAERSIARDLREAGAKYQLRLVCAKCTFEQVWRVKRKPSAYKLASADGWTFRSKGKQAFCFACSKQFVN